MTITSVSGHLTRTDFPSEYQNWNRNLSILFEAPIERKVSTLDPVSLKEYCN